MQSKNLSTNRLISSTVKKQSRNDFNNFFAQSFYQLFIENLVI